MDYRLEVFIKLADIFESHGYHLYLVGGSVRDYLLGLTLSDMDVVSDATPEEEKEFLEGAEYTFEKYGSVRFNFEGVKFDITTLRQETGYKDSRHPTEVVFTDKLEVDVLRRDITINALYLSKDLKVIDLVNGQEDLKNKIIRMIGDPDKRFNEDPLRILRVLRFKIDFGFEIEKNTYKSLENNISLIDLLNPEKVKQEVNKCSKPLELLTLLNELE